MSVIPLGRRIAIALLTLLLAGALFRGHISAALVTRGDDAIRNGDRDAALRYYSRALRVDAASSQAADRLAFSLAMQHQPGDAQRAIAVASAALAQRASNAALFADRGFAEERLRRWRAAQDDFGRAGSAGHDARYDHLAGRLALRLGDVRTARRYFALALATDAAFDPARAALRALQ